MALSLATWSALFVLFPLAGLIAFYIHFKLVGSKYWEKRNVPHLKPLFFLGNMWRASITKNVFEEVKDIYAANKKKKIIGLWAFTDPQLMVMDVELAKRILIKDFNMFRNRGFNFNTESDPLSGHLFSLNDTEWRNLRVKLTPTFTSGKMKLMFPIMAQCADELQKFLRTKAEKNTPVEVKDLMARYTTDTISSCAFGIETNSIRNPDSEFRKFGRKVVSANLLTNIIVTFSIFFPKLAKLFRVRFVPKDSSDFFINAVRDTVEYREKNNQVRNDFLQLLIQLMREGKVEDADRHKIEVKDLDDEAVVKKFTLTDAAAQCFFFFLGGFETSSSTLMFALYELALNPDIQKKLQKEIDEEVKKRGITYEGMMAMKYLDMLVQETLRKHPPVGIIRRKSNAEYLIPELGVTLEKGTTVLFALRGFHHDPDLYPDPERFDPERFSPEEKSQNDRKIFLSFGEGPRNCIGNRFALMQIKLALIYILIEYSVEVTKSTPLRLKYVPRNFFPVPINGMPLAFSKRY